MNFGQLFHPNKIILLFFFTFAIVIGIGVVSILISGQKQQEQAKRTVAIPKDAVFVPEELIVNFQREYAPNKERYHTIEPILKDLGMISFEQLFPGNEQLENYYALTFKEGTDIRSVHEKLQTSDAILNSEPNYIFTTQVIPNDPLFSRLWGFTKIQIPDAWNVTKGSNTIKIAVIDTGVDYNHPDFSGRNIIKGRDFTTCNFVDINSQRCLEPKSEDDDPMDEHGHGTHVAGVIGAAVDNLTGISGINWNGSILAVRISNKQGFSDALDLVNGLKYSIDQGSNVVNVSLGSIAPCTPLLQDIINYGRTKNTLVVVAAGNDSIDARNFNPASCDGVLVVGSSDEQDKRASFSNYGPRIDIAAPGTNILSLKSALCTPQQCPTGAIVNEQYVLASGTSMSAPHVAAVAGLLLGGKSNMTIDKVKECIIQSGDAVQTDLPIAKRLNAKKALTACGILGQIPTQTLTPIVSVTPTRPQVSNTPVPTVITPTSVASAATCNVSIVSRNESNSNFNRVTLSFGGRGGTVILQMGQKGSAMQSTNTFERNGFFSPNSLKAFSNQDAEKITGQIPDVFGGNGPFDSTVVKANGQVTQFKIYEWLKKYKTSPTASTFTEGNDRAWWYFIDYCEGASTPCLNSNIQVDIPKNMSSWFFCSVRDYSKDTLLCIGNPVCSYNNGPDVGARSGTACLAWQRSCSESDYVAYDAGNTQPQSVEEGFKLDFFIP